MHQDPSIFYYFWHAGLVVKLVMLILLSASVASWTFIFQRAKHLKNAQKELQAFEDEFWSGASVTTLYQNVSQQDNPEGLAAIFSAGFKEFLRLRQQPVVKPVAVVEGVQRAMRVAEMRVLDRMETSLPFLATVGSVSPYVGLFGTVWGIMVSFQALSGVGQATIAMVAPGISEALIATAMGLFAAIPAVIAYNRYTHRIDKIANRFEAFQEEFANMLYRHAQEAQES